MQTMETNYFRVMYDEKDENVISQIVSVIDDTYETVIEQFDLSEDSELFTIYICPDVQSYIQFTGKREEEYQEWMVGYADYTNKKLCLLSSNVVQDRSFEDMIKVCRHEIVHIAFDQLGNPEETDIFIGEGIAVALAEQMDIPSLSLEEYPLAGKLSDEDYFYDNNGYLYSGVYVLYLIKKYGAEVYKRIYSGEEPLGKYLYDGFEKEAIQSLLCEVNNK